MKPPYDQYCDYHARQCKRCSGQKHLLINNVLTVCSCQYNASAKWQLDQIEIYPEELKYKTWSDFVGISKHGRLTTKSFLEAKTKALRYCFGSDSPESFKNRAKNLIVHEHLSDGQNVVIAGPSSSGKTLIAVLILKEVMFACGLQGKNIGFTWVRANKLIDAARWDAFGIQQTKAIDYELLDHVEKVNFLFIDNVDLAPSSGNHRRPPDMMSIDNIFSSRMASRLPTIVMCSDRLFHSLLNPASANEIRLQYGEDFFSTITHPNNVLIDLQKEAKNF